MELAAIYNVFDGEELLEGSINQIRNEVDTVIAVVQTVSNRGYYYNGGNKEAIRLKNKRLIDHIVYFDPNVALMAGTNEKNKRNQGLELAKELNYSHYIMMDCDEYYNSTEFLLAKNSIADEKSAVVPLYTYYGSPEFRLSPKEDYFVPFICKIEPNTRVGNYDNGYYCDPTRKPNNGKAVKLDLHMHHYSWIRKDIKRKIENSSAYTNLKHLKNEIIESCKEPFEGMQTPLYEDKTLKRTQDWFNIRRVFELVHGETRETTQ